VLVAHRYYFAVPINEVVFFVGKDFGEAEGVNEEISATLKGWKFNQVQYKRCQ